MWAFVVVLAVAVSTIALLTIPTLVQQQRRLRACVTDNDLLRARLARTRAWQRLPEPLRPQFEAYVRIFVAERQFIGCGGLKITEPMRMAVAADACLLLMGHRNHLYDDLREILIYPGEFIVPDLWEEHGVVTEESRPLSGQTWDTSRIILSWEDVQQAGPGYNVVIHEFAHYHDSILGITNGASGSDWKTLLEEAFEILKAAETDGSPCVLDAYGLESDAEFFAVASESFFEEPEALQDDFPNIYTALTTVYGLSPLDWE